MLSVDTMAKGKVERKGGAGGHEEDQEQKLQAILLADSFNTNFRPISNDVPKVKSDVCLVLLGQRKDRLNSCNQAGHLWTSHFVCLFRTSIRVQP